MAGYFDPQRRQRRAARRASHRFDAANLAIVGLTALVLASCGRGDRPGGGPGGTPERRPGRQALQNTPPRSLGYLNGSCYAVSVVNVDALLSSDVVRQSDDAESTLGQITFGHSDAIRADFALEVGVEDLWIAGVNVPWISRWTEIKTEEHGSSVHLLDLGQDLPADTLEKLRQGTAESVGDQTLYGDSWESYCFADPRTVVFGPTDAVRALFDPAQKSEMPEVLQNLLKSLDFTHGVVGATIRPKRLFARERPMFMDGRSGMPDSEVRLFEGVDGLTFQAEVDEGAQLEWTVHCNDPASAEAFKEQGERNVANYIKLHCSDEAIAQEQKDLAEKSREEVERDWVFGSPSQTRRLIDLIEISISEGNVRVKAEFPAERMDDGDGPRFVYGFLKLFVL